MACCGQRTTESSARETYPWEDDNAKAFLDAVWEDLRKKSPKDITRVAEVVRITLESTQLDIRSIQELCSALNEFPAHITTYGTTFLQGEQRLELCDGFPQFRMFKFTPATNMPSMYRAAFGLTSATSDACDEKLDHLLRNVLAHKEYEEAVTKLIGYDASRALELMDKLCNSDSEYWKNFSARGSAEYQVDFNNAKRRRLRRLQMKLAVSSRSLPPTVWVNFKANDVEKNYFTIGSCGEIRRSRDGKFAIKRVQLSLKEPSDQQRQTARIVIEALLAEALIWRTLKHPHIVPLLGIEKNTFNLDNNPCIGFVMPFFPRGNALDCLVKLAPKGPFPLITSWIRQIASALEYLHEQDIVHGDLRCSNILAESDTVVKLIDFGISIPLKSRMSSLAHTVPPGGTYRWMSRETLIALNNYEQGSPSGFDDSWLPTSVDIYAFAATCIELYGRVAPRLSPHEQRLSDHQIRELIMAGASFIRPKTGEPIPDALWDLLQRCLGDPQGRPTATEILQSAALAA